VYFAQGRFDDAAEEYLTALKLKPDLHAALENMKLLQQAMSHKPVGISKRFQDFILESMTRTLSL
jgi:hypothetical protein